MGGVMNDWHDPDNTNYHVKQTQLKRLAGLSEHLLMELAVRESSTFNGDKTTWLLGYCGAILDVVEALGEDYLPNSDELCMVTRGHPAADCLARLREGRRRK
jgi:hypothetical protein